MLYAYDVELNLPVNENFCNDYFWQRLRTNNFEWNTTTQLHKLLTKQGWEIIRRTCTEREDDKAVHLLETIYRLGIRAYYTD